MRHGGCRQWHRVCLRNPCRSPGARGVSARGTLSGPELHSPLHAFPVPGECPDSVRKPLIQSFALFLSAPGAAANTIRIAVEKLLTALGVAPARNLVRRINALPEAYSDLKRALTTMKFLGNAGSHESDRVTTTDIEQTYTILEFVLRKIYVGSTESVEELIARLDDRFRPDTESE